MTVRFEYKCDKCSFEYLEQRGNDEPQIVTTCTSCKEGNFTEVNKVVLSPNIERSEVVVPQEEATPLPDDLGLIP